MARTAVRVSTYDDPEEYARKACQYHEENDGPAVSHRDALILVGMTDPLQLNKAVGLMRNMCAENGAFHHLTVEKKYVETSAKTAEDRQVPRGRSLAKMETRRIKAVDDAKKSVDRMEHLPAEFKAQVFELGDAIVDGAGKTQNIDRTADLIEFKRTISALTDKFVRKATERAERAEAQVSERDARIASLEDQVQWFRGMMAKMAPGGVGGDGNIGTALVQK